MSGTLGHGVLNASMQALIIIDSIFAFDVFLFFEIKTCVFGLPVRLRHSVISFQNLNWLPRLCFWIVITFKQMGIIIGLLNSISYTPIKIHFHGLQCIFDTLGSFFLLFPSKQFFTRNFWELRHKFNKRRILPLLELDIFRTKPGIILSYKMTETGFIFHSVELESFDD